MKRRMTLALSRYGISITYQCYKLPGYGKKCIERDNGYHCMTCKYCKADMSGRDATRMLESFTREKDA